MNILNDLFTIYWSQVTLIALGFGYLIKHFFETYSKKKQISYTFFQERKLSALKNFLECYSRIELMWESLPIFKVIDNSISTNQLDNLIFTEVDEFKRTLLEVKMFFNDSEYEDFNKIRTNIFEINGFVKDQYFNSAKEETAIAVSNNYHGLIKKIFKENNLLINKILNINRKNYN